jgi:anti-anti-sigma factor
MEISRLHSGDSLELVVKGRLDAYWADALTKELERAVRGGDHHVRLNLAGVTYISSIGIRVLVQFYQQLQGIQGSFVVSSPSEPVKKVLEMSGLGRLLAASAATAAAAPAAVPETGRRIEKQDAVYEVFEVSSGASLRCQLLGDPGLLEGCRFDAAHSRTAHFPASTLAVGLGAFGHDFEECRSRFGEFLALGGAAAYQPTDGSNVADYLVAEGSFVPELQVLYAAVCEGTFSHLLRFEARAETGGLRLSSLARTALEITGGNAAGLAMVAESAGLLGAALRQSPARGSAEGAPFRHPEIRQWLSFSPERTHKRALAAVAGLATASPDGPLAALVRPLGNGAGVAGHFHAAAFSYRPLQKGRLELALAVQSLFQAETLQGVLHLLADQREAAGAVESEFVRGACWVAPVSQITPEKA